MPCKRLGQRTLFMLVIIILAGATAGADGPAGAWKMVSYEGGAARGAVSGLLLLADGNFSLTYVMDDAKERVGRAHAGTYDVSGNKLVYHVQWSMVSGQPVAAKPTDRETTFSIEGNTLTVRFTNGSVQKFQRAK